MRKLILFTLIISIALFQSCTKKSERYIALGGNEIPAFLDTETKEVYSVETFHDHKPIIRKTSLNEVK